jgi:peroxiredoxin
LQSAPGNSANRNKQGFCSTIAKIGQFHLILLPEQAGILRFSTFFTHVPMALTHTPICKFGEPAIDFNLPGTDGRTWTLANCAGRTGLLVMFICNHCPYVRAINRKLVRDALDLLELGVNSVAIMPNDTATYPEDSLENMRRMAEEMQYPFPYLIDESQTISRAYGAVCTPDFFGYDRNLQLQYRGRLDESGARPDAGDVSRDLYLAMKQIADTGMGPKLQIASMGCSIKWREN